MEKTNDHFTSRELAKESFLLTWNNLKQHNFKRIVLGFTQDKTFGMYLGVKEAADELKLNIEILVLSDIKGTYNEKEKIYDFFKIPKQLFNDSLIFDNTPYSKAVGIVEYLLKLKSNCVFALQCAGFTANNFLNKYDLLYLYICNTNFTDKEGNKRMFPTAIVCNQLGKISSNQRKKNNLSTIDKFKNNKVLSTTDIFTILKYFDIDKNKVIKLSNDFYGGILIKGFSNLDNKIIKPYKDFGGILSK